MTARKVKVAGDTGLADVLQDILDTHGVLEPSVIVEEAAAEDHPLHHRFEWDDSLAAAQHRFDQARGLIRKAEIVIIRSGPQEPVRVRAFVPQRVVDPDGESHRYVSVRSLTDAQKARLLDQMRREWQQLRRRYAAHEEFLPMVREDIDG